MCTTSAGGGASGGASLLLGRLAAGLGAGGALVGADGVVSGGALGSWLGLELVVHMCTAGAGYGASGCCSFGCQLGQLGSQLPPLDSCTLAWLSAFVGWQLCQNQAYIASSEYLQSSELLFCHFCRIYNGNWEGFDL